MADTPIDDIHSPRVALAVKHIKNDCSNIDNLDVEEVRKQELSDALETLNMVAARINDTEVLARLYRPILLLMEEKREMDAMAWQAKLEKMESTTHKLFQQAAVTIQTTADNLANEIKLREEADEIPLTKAQSNEVEQKTARSIAAFIKGEVVKMSYKFRRQVQNFCGDIDGLVWGEYEGRKVVVICEAKVNMDSNEANAGAIKQLVENYERWQHYKFLRGRGNDVDTPWLEYGEGDNDIIAKADEKDMAELDFNELCAYDVIFALGGGTFSAATVTRVRGLQQKSAVLSNKTLLISRPHAAVTNIDTAI